MSSTYLRWESRLRDLIEHPNTSDQERALAERRLQALRRKTPHGARSNTTSPAGSPGSPVERTTHGRKYDAELDYPAITTLIRAEIALARQLARHHTEDSAELAVFEPIGAVPAQVRFRVTVHRRYRSNDRRKLRCRGCGAHITISIQNVPEDWGWASQPALSPPVPTPALQALVDELKDLAGAYNRHTTYTVRRPDGGSFVGSLNRLFEGTIAASPGGGTWFF